MIILHFLFREPPLSAGFHGPRQPEGLGERRLLLPPRGQRHEAPGTAAPETVATLHGSLPRRHPELHRSGSSAETGLHPDLRLVVRRSHPVRDDNRPAAVLRGDHRRDSG
jgi:hypothetical protein